MKNKKNQSFDWDAFEELLQETEKSNQKKETKINQPTPRNNLMDIISKARENMNSLNKNKWKSNDSEEDIVAAAKAKGKSQYDADVLRETILKRQAEKRAGTSMSGFLDAVKKKKDEYGK